MQQSTPQATPPAKRARALQEESDIQEVAVVKQEGEGGVYTGGGQQEGAYQEDQGHHSTGGEIISYDQDEMYDDYYEVSSFNIPMSVCL